MRTITDIDTSFFLSAACNVIESGDPVDGRGVLASAVLQFHIPEEIGELSHSDFIEIRKRYEELRETYPLYLRDLGELIQVDEIKQVAAHLGPLSTHTPRQLLSSPQQLRCSRI
jgi:hypothetical protein